MTEKNQHSSLEIWLLNYVGWKTFKVQSNTNKPKMKLTTNQTTVYQTGTQTTQTQCGTNVPRLAAPEAALDGRAV